MLFHLQNVEESLDKFILTNQQKNSIIRKLLKMNYTNQQKLIYYFENDFFIYNPREIGIFLNHFLFLLLVIR